jgi:Lrp/AsnC family transcriptional regulator for asnA, asnC and gidA
MDKTDIILTFLLLANSRLPYSDLAERLGLSVNAVHKRIQLLKETGVIRNFTAKISIAALGIVSILVFGSSETQFGEQVLQRLQENDRTYWVAVGSGNYLYIGAYLRNISELDPYVTFVKKEAKMPSPTVGIVVLGDTDVAHSDAKLQNLDYRIIYALCKDSRKAIPEIAEEIVVSAKTIRRRLARMISEHLIDLSLEWFPDKANDIMTLFQVDLKAQADKAKAVTLLNKEYSPNALFCWTFSNLPNSILFFVWTNSMKELQDISKRIQGEESFERALPRILYTGYIFDTWRDKLVLEKGAPPVGRSQPNMRSSPR